MFNSINKSDETAGRFKNYFLGSGLELFSSDPISTNQKIADFQPREKFGNLSFSAQKNNLGSIWVGYIERSEFIEIPLNILNKKSRDHEWMEVRILRELLSLGHIVRGADIIVEMKDHGVFQSRYMEGLTFLKALNEVNKLNIQPSKMIEILDKSLSVNFGKRAGHVFGVFSNIDKTGSEVKGKGVFSFADVNPFLPLLFFSRKGFTSLWNHGIVKYDLEDLKKWSRDYWSEFLSPLEQYSLDFFIELGKIGNMIPDQLIRRKRRKGNLEFSFAA